jgi:hypothetical protein
MSWHHLSSKAPNKYESTESLKLYKINLIELNFQGVYVKPFLMALALMLFQQFSGINAIMFYLVSIILNFFPSSLMMRPNKLEGLPLEPLSSQVFEFEGKAKANPIGAPFRCSLLG